MARKQPQVQKVNIVLHQHDMGNFLVCPFKYYMSNVACYQVRGIKKALNIGDVFSKCVYFLHNGIDLTKCMAYVESLQLPLIQKATSQEKIDELEASSVIVRAMLMGYEETFLKKDKIKVTKYNDSGGILGFEEINIEKIIPEYKIEPIVSIGNYHYQYINRLDGKILTKANPWILEIKTTTKMDSDLLKKLNTNFQLNSYWYALLTKEQNTIDGVLYRYIKKPSVKQKKDETIANFQRRLALDYVERQDNYFYEESLYLNQNAIVIFIANLRHFFEEMTRCYLMNSWVQKGTACDNNYGLCEYIKYCSNPTQQTLEAYYETATT